jgi:hypothetical protein
MAKVTGQFNMCIQISQEIGTESEHMLSKILFTLSIDGKSLGSFSVDVKQTVGGNYENDAIEVMGLPKELNGKINYQAFRDAVERYYRNIVGANAHCFHVGKGASISMTNNVINSNMPFEFSVDTSTVAW